ncbi:MAG: hypothetical protein VX730_03150 [Pseudomonadota bacterium]|nr:hypothetical protein [Pseudomonadota bacterium]
MIYLKSCLEKREVAVCLLGKWCYRPVLARYIKEDIYEILPSACYGPAYEEWQFVPGTLVHCVEVNAANIHKYDLLYSGCLSGREKTKVAYSIAALT